jgi:hypothetical protein
MARGGDNTMTPFECNICVFHKSCRCPPNPSSTKDELLLACIRRENLDSFWSRSSETVKKHLGPVRMGIQMASLVGIPPPIPPPSPLPDFDYCGYGVAIQMLLKSRLVGKYHTTHQQWDTIHKLRTAYGNQVRASGASNASVWLLCNGEGKNYQRFSDDPRAFMWFMRFLTGCKR